MVLVYWEFGKQRVRPKEELRGKGRQQKGEKREAWDQDAKSPSSADDHAGWPQENYLIPGAGTEASTPTSQDCHKKHMR